MQREILFKAKRKDNGEWVEGYLFKTPLTAEFDCDGQYFSSMVKRICIANEDGCVFEVIPETICQYTGLEDNVGDKIFENDILRNYSNEIEDWIVSYEYGNFVGTYDNVCEDLWEIHDFEVIGNVWNSENMKVIDLLEKQGVCDE